MKKYPSTEQFRNIVHNVRSQHNYAGVDETGAAIYKDNGEYPKLSFTGTVKLHGTNSAIVKHASGEVEFQSRNRVLTIGSDNAGFALAMSGKELDSLFDGLEFYDYAAIYGEWCGGNIQSGVAITGLEKMFVIFALDLDGEWTEFRKSSPEQNIYNILDFETYKIEVDFNYPEKVQNEIIEMTLTVEEECPVGKHFGVSGVGEGIVFTCDSNRSIKFKSKGEKHSTSKVKTLASVNVEDVAAVEDFVNNVCTSSRLNQGLDYMREMQIETTTKNTGDFIRWVVNDVMKEEEDTIIKNQLNVKTINSHIARTAKTFYFNNLTK